MSIKKKKKKLQKKSAVQSNSRQIKIFSANKKNGVQVIERNLSQEPQRSIKWKYLKLY